MRQHLADYLHYSSPRWRREREKGAENLFEDIMGDFPGGTVVGNPPANAWDTGSIPGLGRSHMLRSS